MSKTICVKCDYCSFRCYCLKHPIYSWMNTDYVTGREVRIYGEPVYCKHKNYKGNCPDFTPRRPWWQRLIRPRQS